VRVFVVLVGGRHLVFVVLLAGAAARPFFLPMCGFEALRRRSRSSGSAEQRKHGGSAEQRKPWPAPTHLPPLRRRSCWWPRGRPGAARASAMEVLQHGGLLVWRRQRQLRAATATAASCGGGGICSSFGSWRSSVGRTTPAVLPQDLLSPHLGQGADEWSRAGPAPHRR
jgi:hypothetical protein